MRATPRQEGRAMPSSVVSDDFVRQLQGFHLTTAEILYRMPDCQALLQTFIWQDYDLAPKFPVLHKFLDFWRESLDGPLHSVRIARVGLIAQRNPRGARTGVAPLNQLQTFQRNVALPSDNNVVVDGDPERRGDGDDF
jgi:uncharacterized protein Usg